MRILNFLTQFKIKFLGGRFYGFKNSLKKPWLYNFLVTVSVRLVTPDVVLAALVTDCENYDFCMCNPPFFADKSEIVESRSRTGCRPQPNSVCTGSESETVTSGGEVEFVGRIIDDSLKLGTRIK